MKPIFGVLVLIALFPDLIAAADPSTNAPKEAAAAKPLEGAVEAFSDNELRALGIESAELELQMLTLPPTVPAKRDAAVFLTIATNRLQVMGLSGMADPRTFREADRVMSRALNRVKQAGPAMASFADQGERILQAYRLVHVGSNRSLGFHEIDQLLGIPAEKVKNNPRPGAEQRKSISDPTRAIVRFADLISACIEGRESVGKGDRTAAIYTAPLAQLQLFAGDPMVVAMENVSDRLKGEYGVRHGNDYFFLAEEIEGPPKYLVQYENPEVGPVTPTVVTPEEQKVGVDWKGSVTVRPKSVRVYDSRRPAGQRWEVKKGSGGLTFMLSRERGVYYVDAIDRAGDHAPAAMVTVYSKVLRALEDK